MVDIGAESTWIDAKVLEGIGIERRKKDLQFQLANGQIITRSVGYAVLKVDKSETVDEVVFAEKGDLQLLGARALEGLNLHGDSRRKKLGGCWPDPQRRRSAAAIRTIGPGCHRRTQGCPPEDQRDETNKPRRSPITYPQKRSQAPSA